MKSLSTQNPKLFKKIIWILWTCGYIWDMRPYFVNLSKRRLFAMKCWTAIISAQKIVIFILISVNLVMLEDNVLLVGCVMEYLSFIACFFLCFVCHYKSKIFENLIFIVESEYSKQNTDYELVKKITYSSLFLSLLPPFLLSSMTILQFFFNSYLQLFFDSVFSFFRVQISDTNFWYSMIAATWTTSIGMFITTAGQITLFVSVVFLAVFNKRRLDLVLSSAKYDHAKDLRKTRKLLTEIEYSVSKINDYASFQIFVLVTIGIFIFCVSVINYFIGYRVLSGYHFNCTLMITLTGIFLLTLGYFAVLLTDQKTNSSVQKVYQMSATKDPRDLDYAIEAEMLAKQIESTKVYVKLWKFYAFNRLSVLQLVCSMISYVVIVVKFIPGAQEFIINLND